MIFDPAYYRRHALFVRTQAITQCDGTRRNELLKVAEHFEALAADIQTWTIRRSVAPHGSDLLRLF